MKELNEMELREVDGGLAWLAVIAVVGFALAVTAQVEYVVDNWDKVEAGWAAGKAAANK